MVRIVPVGANPPHLRSHGSDAKGSDRGKRGIGRISAHGI